MSPLAIPPRPLPLLSLALLAGGLGGCLGGGGGGGDTSTISGRVMMAAARSAAVTGSRHVTHVMAVNPQSASPQRTIAAVGADGSFQLSIATGVPYVLVFVDNTAVGADMAVAVFRAGTLDTLSPQLADHLSLGDVTVDAATGTASPGISYDQLVTELGLTASAAEYLGSIDDLSLRYANPDIDGDGVIDLTQSHNYALDFHVRSTMHIGADNGPSVTVSDLTDQFLADSGPQVATPVFNLTSAYVLYPATLDATQYVSQSAPPTVLQNGAAFSATQTSGAVAAPTSFSSLGFGDTRGWGADYDYTSSPTLELPGSGGSPATLRYTLGAIGRTLTFSNIVTRTRASLTESGTLAIFLRLVTSGGAFKSIDYKWMKRASAATWVPATADEIAVAIGSSGGYLSVHRAPSWSNEFGTAIPPQPSGSIPWTWAATGPGDVCALAVSYDDKLGLRHFIGGADADASVHCTF